MDEPRRARQLLACLDLTVLDEGTDAATVVALCERACTPQGAVAAVCIPPDQVATARAALGAGSSVRIATVANFPSGEQPLAAVLDTISRALAAGVDELDVVLPWRRLGPAPGQDPAGVGQFLRAVRAATGRATLKIILETGELAEPLRIRHASDLAIDAGADFIKTSTGKVPVNATPQAAEVMLRAIRHAGGHCGFKASGGIRTLLDAVTYLELAEAALGARWLGPRRFRIGASGLLDALLAALGGAAPAADAGE